MPLGYSTWTDLFKRRDSSNFPRKMTFNQWKTLEEVFTHASLLSFFSFHLQWLFLSFQASAQLHSSRNKRVTQHMFTPSLVACGHVVHDLRHSRLKQFNFWLCSRLCPWGSQRSSLEWSTLWGAWTGQVQTQLQSHEQRSHHRHDHAHPSAEVPKWCYPNMIGSSMRSATTFGWLEENCTGLTGFTQLAAMSSALIRGTLPWTPWSQSLHRH